MVEFDWLLQPRRGTVLNLKNVFDMFCGAWSEHHLCQVSRGLVNICGRGNILKDFDNFQHGDQILMFR